LQTFFAAAPAALHPSAAISRHQQKSAEFPSPALHGMVSTVLRITGKD
jgi:hypothetical protein